MSRNLAPAFGNLGVPVMDSARGLETGEWQASWGLHWASHSHRESDAGEALEYDGETRRHDLGLALGLGRGLTLSVNLPWISHDGGSLDPLIEDWHKFWGMPNGDRDRQPDDALLFALSGADGDGFLLEDSASGLGDVELGLAWTFWSGADGTAFSAYTQYKLATGDLDDFTGSDKGALALGLRYSSAACLLELLRCHAQFGVLNTGTPRIGPAVDDTLLFGGFTLAWTMTPTLAVIGQVEVQEQPFDSPAFDATGTAVLGTLGLRWLPGSRWRLESQFSEDLNVGSAPDITFRFAVTRTW